MDRLQNIIPSSILTECGCKALVTTCCKESFRRLQAFCYTLSAPRVLWSWKNFDMQRAMTRYKYRTIRYYEYVPTSWPCKIQFCGLFRNAYREHSSTCRRRREPIWHVRQYWHIQGFTLRKPLRTKTMQERLSSRYVSQSWPHLPISSSAWYFTLICWMTTRLTSFGLSVYRCGQQFPFGQRSMGIVRRSNHCSETGTTCNEHLY